VNELGTENKVGTQIYLAGSPGSAPHCHYDELGSEVFEKGSTVGGISESPVLGNNLDSNTSALKDAEYGKIPEESYELIESKFGLKLSKNDDHHYGTADLNSRSCFVEELLEEENDSQSEAEDAETTVIPHVPAIIFNEECYLALDSGADKNLISVEMFSKFNRKPYSNIQRLPVKGLITTAIGKKKFSVDSQIQLTLTLGGVDLNLCFLVVKDLNSDCGVPLAQFRKQHNVGGSPLDFFL
jgi:hypothetical protein